MRDLKPPDAKVDSAVLQYRDHVGQVIAGSVLSVNLNAIHNTSELKLYVTSAVDGKLCSSYAGTGFR